MNRLWIIDAMNVIGSRPDGWWKERRSALARLVGLVERWAQSQENRVTLVLEQPMSPPIGSSLIEIAHAPRAARNSADDEIVRLVEAAPEPSDITVVTSDSALSERVRRVGASVFPAAAFRNLVDPAR